MPTPTTLTRPMNLHAVRGATLLHDPWTHAIITDTFHTAEITAALVDSYPTAGFKRLTQHTDDKSFDLEARNDLTLRNPDDPCPWQRLLHQLTSPDYRAAMAHLTGLDLHDAILKIAFYRYGPSCWFSPHRDDERKLVSHIVYANTGWPPDAGGQLLINRTNNMDDVHTWVVPVAGTSVVVVRSDSSWHSVQPVYPGHGGHRRSLIAHFYRPGSDVDFYDS